jgi:betaine lipid synthase
MDHVDWLEEGAGRALAAALGEQVRPGGRVIWRSAALEPRHAAWVAAAGFEVRCVRRADDGHGLMDRVNMYASFHVATRRAE